MIEPDKFYGGEVAGAKWYPNAEDPDAPQLGILLAVDGDEIRHYLRTDTPENITKTMRQLKALHVPESAIHTEKFIDDPFGVIGPVRCRFKTRMTKTGKTAVGFLCDQSAEPLETATKSGLLARLKKATFNAHGVAADESDLPF